MDTSKVPSSVIVKKAPVCSCLWLQFAIVLWALVLLGSPAVAQVYSVVEVSNPAGLVSKVTPVNSGSLYTSTTAAVDINTSRFAHWKLNGVRQADAAGRAQNPVTFSVSSAATLEAVYVSATADTDLDGVLDAFELQFFDSLQSPAFSDLDGDGWELLVESLLGYHPGLPDTVVEGGVARRATPMVALQLSSAVFPVSFKSEPPGLLSSTPVFSSGTASVTLPAPVALVLGFRFTGWYCDGVRVDGPATLHPLSVQVTAATTFTARYVAESQDGDADGLADWFEWFVFGSLDLNAASDSDADGWNALLEQLLGFAAYLPNQVVEGGIARRGSGVETLVLRVQKTLAISSDPPGLQPESMVVVNAGSLAGTPDYSGALVNGYRFVAWEVNGRRILDGSLASAGSAAVVMTENGTAISKWVAESLDSDADGVTDWFELFYAGDLRFGAASDSDADGFGYLLENLLGMHPGLVNTIREGGISRRGSALSAIVLADQPSISRLLGGGTYSVGEAMALTVEARGGVPLSYQWVRNGIALEGATSALFKLERPDFSDAGDYEVVVSNALGTVRSGSMHVMVADFTAPVVMVPSRVIVDSAGPEGATVVYPPATATDNWTANPTIEYSHGSGSVFPVGITPVTVTAHDAAGNVSRGVFNVEVYRDAPILTALPPRLLALRGAVRYAPVRVRSDFISGNYALIPEDAANAVPRVEGRIPVSGILNLPLGSMPLPGKYRLRVMRTEEDGMVRSGESAPFDVLVRSRAQIEGTYETLLENEPREGGQRGAPEFYRGLLRVSLTTSGKFSGNLRYAETPLLLDGAGNPAPNFPRYVNPCSRSFHGAFGASSDGSLSEYATVRLGNVGGGSLQSLSLEVDWSVDPPVLKAVHVDGSSGAQAQPYRSSSTFRSRVPIALSDSATRGKIAALAGRYALLSRSTTAPDGSRIGHAVSLQVWPSGRSAWMTRFPGYVGTGSAEVQISALLPPSISICEMRASSSQGVFSSSTLMGEIVFRESVNAEWRAVVGSETLPGCLEHQSTFVSLGAEMGTSPRYDILFHQGNRWSWSVPIGFKPGAAVRWGTALTPHVPGWISSGSVLRLRAQYGETASAESALYQAEWDVRVSVLGAGVVSAVPVGGAPPLSLKLDRSSGFWSGGFTDPVTLRRVRIGGVAFSDAVEGKTRGAGWLETSVSGVDRAIGAWEAE